MHLIGGGALSKIWSQILADILERPIKQVSFPRFANARGAAWIAAITLGHITSQDIEHLNIFDEIYLPQKKDQKIYTQLYREFLSIYTQNKSIYQRLNL